MATRKLCYGEMFPNLDRLEYNQPLQGKVFTVVVESKGIGISGRAITVNEEQWEDCTSCEHYRNCYDLGTARLLLTHVVDSKAP